MKLDHPLISSTFVTSILVLSAATLLGAQRSNDRPNVILLFIDDLGYGDIGAFGCKDIPTPHIDRLAKEGVTLTQNYVTNPPCCPSRASLLTGMYAQRFGKYGMMREQPLPEDKPTFAEIFRDHRYVTGQIGKWDVGGGRYVKPWSRGFMEVGVAPPKVEGRSFFLRKDENGKDFWLTELDGDQLVEFVDRHRKKDQRFMMYWSPLAVHSSHDWIPEKYPARTTASKERRKLAGGIVSLDDQIGKLLDYLDTHKMRENTLIIFASDNGPNIGEGGTSTPYEGGKGKGRQKIGWTLTPAIVSWPGVIPKGTRFDGMMCTFDFYATMLAAAKLPIPEHIDGVDLMPYLTGKKKGNVREYIFWLNKGSSNLTRNLEAVRWGKWRAYRMLATDAWRLYDLEADPREEDDLAKKFPEVLNQLDQKHSEWRSKLPPMWEAPKSGRVPRMADQELSEKSGWIITDGRVVYKEVDAPQRPGNKDHKRGNQGKMKLNEIKKPETPRKKPPSKAGEQTSKTNEFLARYLKKNPAADADRDGILTGSEFKKHRASKGKGRQ